MKNTIKHLSSITGTLYSLAIISHMMLIAITSQATTRTWTGATDSDWDLPLNWSPGGIPNPTDDIVIPDVTNDPVLTTMAIIKSLTIENGGYLTISAPFGVLQIDDASNHGIDNAGQLDNYGSINIGQNFNITAQGVFNDGAFTNDGGTINIDNTGNEGIYNDGQFDNKNNGQILIGQNGGNIGGDGIGNSSSGSIINDNSTIIIDNAENDGIDNDANFENNNNGQILIGQNDGNIAVYGIENKGGPGGFINDNSTVRIDNTVNHAIRNRTYGDIDNQNGGWFIIGEIGNIGGSGILNQNSNTTFDNHSCSFIHIASDNIINDFLTFTNDGIIIEEATGNSDININNGIVQNLNGGSFSITTNNGVFTELTGNIWTGCQNNNWSLDDNWNTFEKPGAGDPVLILSPYPGQNYNPKVYNGKTEYAQNVLLESGAELIVDPTGKLIIDNSTDDGIYNNNGTVTNKGTIEIGLVSPIGDNGIENDGTFNNTSNGQITISDTQSSGIFHNSGSFSNEGSISINNIGQAGTSLTMYKGINSNGSFENWGNISIGQNGGSENIYGYGIDSEGDFDNHSGAIIIIDNTRGIYSIFVDEYTFSNEGTINIGQNGGADNIYQHGIFANYGATIENLNSAIINIDNSKFGRGINIILGTFMNAATINIGANGGAENIYSHGIKNSGTFENQTGGIINIDNTGESGISNHDSFSNSANINIGQNGSANNITENGIYNTETFNNNDGGIINIDNTFLDGISNDDTFTNVANINIGQNGSANNITEDGIHNTATFSNNSGGSINILNTGDNGIEIGTGTFTNDATINIGSNGTSWNISGYGIQNEDTFINYSDGVLATENIYKYGINNKLGGSFDNYGEINVGQNGGLNNINSAGLVNASDFVNYSGGLININNTEVYGLFNVGGGTYINGGIINIGLNGLPGNIDNDGLRISTGQFENLSGGVVNIDNTLDEDIENGSTITNQNNATINCSGVVKNGDEFINNGNLNTETSIQITTFGAGTLQGDGNYSFRTEWINDGTFIAGNSTVSITGDSSAVISGNSITTFNNLEIDKGENDLQLQQYVNVNNQLQMTSGNIDLNGNDLTLGTTSGTIIGESASSYIYSTSTGEVIKESDLNIPNNENPGNIGVNITSNANLGTTTIKRGCEAQDVNGQTGIVRYYDISPTNNSGLDATIQFSYLDHELNGIAENDLTPFRYNGVDWDEYLTTDNDDIANWVETTNIDAFSLWTLAELVAPLPVELMFFTARSVENEKVHLEWQTASEENNDYFEIERSSDGFNFTTIGKVWGAGNSDVIQNYQSWDEKPFSGKNYYRLKQMNFDRTFAYSNIKVVEIKSSGSQLSIFPNPTSGTLNFNQSISGNIIIRNVLGQVVWQSGHSEAIQNLDLSFLPASTYLLEHLDHRDNLQTAKFIISKN